MSVRQALPVADGSAMLAELRDLSRGHGRALVGTGVLLVLAAAMALVFPVGVGWIVDTVAGRASSGSRQSVPTIFWWQVAALTVAAVLGGVLHFTGIVSLSRVAETMIATLRERYVERALNLPQATLEQAGTGDVVARAASDIREVSESVPQVLPQLAAAVFTLVLALAGMTVIDWRFGLAMLITVPLYALALRWYLGVAPATYAAERAVESVRSQHVLDTVSALPTVWAYRLQERRRQVTRGAAWELVRWAMRARTIQNVLFSRVNLAEGVGLLLMLGLGFILAVPGWVSIGQVTAASLLFFRLTQPLRVLMFFTDDLQSAAASFARLVGVVQMESASSPAADQRTLGRHAVELRDVEFAYVPGHPVLSGLTLTIGEREHVAIVGASGSGKTSLARLIAGSHHPDRGSVQRGVARTEVAYVSQEHHVFAGTLRDNLDLVLPDAVLADDETLIEALQRVGADRLLATLPEGLDTRIGQAGHAVTPADAQLLALARLVVKSPRIAILDEATAEADARDTTVLDRAVQQAIVGRCAVIIAHRLEQATVCDRIIVLDRGRIVEQGTHEELERAGGPYAELWAAWSRGRVRGARAD